jgi:FRG domain
MVSSMEVRDTAELINAARQICRGFGHTQYWFRGHAVADWKLVPSVHRNYDAQGEHNLMARFRLAAPTRHEKCPQLHDWASWISLMQHYGLPTRLLDWSGSLLAAVYFAVAYDPQSGPSAVWILLPSGLNKASCHAQECTFTLTGSEAQPLLQAAFVDGAVIDEVVAVYGQDTSLRMALQMGAFTIHGTAKPLEEREGAHQFLAKLIIPEEAKATFEEELWVPGIRRSTLFLDLANLALELTNDHRLIPKREQSRGA